MEVRTKPSKHGFIDTLTNQEVQKAIDIIESLNDIWVQRYEADSYTLGATLYEDIKKPGGVSTYIHIARNINPILEKNFGWLYDIVIQKLSQEFDEQFKLTDKLGYPGFHIFGHRPGKLNSELSVNVMQTPVAAIHYDRQYEDLSSYWRTTFYSDIDYANPLSFTLSIELPKNGGGLSTWGINDYEPDNDYVKFLKKLDYSNHEYGYIGAPDFVPYTIGKMFYFVGDMLHQISPAYKMDYTDRRITLQGHAIKCKNIWRVYF